MRRGMKIRVAFSPTRLSAEHLRAAYERVFPVKRIHTEKKIEEAKQLAVRLSVESPQREGKNAS